MAAAALRGPAWTSTIWIWMGTRLREFSISTRTSRRGSGTSTTAISPLDSPPVTARHKVVLPLPGGPVMPTDFTWREHTGGTPEAPLKAPGQWRARGAPQGAGSRKETDVLEITDDAAAVLERAY